MSFWNKKLIFALAFLNNNSGLLTALINHFKYPYLLKIDSLEFCNALLTMN